MIEKISKKLTNYIVIKGSIKESEKDIYEYGMTSFLAMGCNTISFLLICYMCDMFFEGIIYGVLFIILRIYAGGAHLSSNIICFFASSSLVIGTLLLVKYTPIDEIILITLTMIIAIVIWVLSPVEAKNKPLDKIEYKIYRFRARAILLLELLMMTVCVYMRMKTIGYIISLVILEVGIIMVIGSIINNRYSENSKF